MKPHRYHASRGSATINKVGCNTHGHISKLALRFENMVASGRPRSEIGGLIVLTRCLAEDVLGIAGNRDIDEKMLIGRESYGMVGRIQDPKREIVSSAIRILRAASFNILLSSRKIACTRRKGRYANSGGDRR